MTDQKWLSNHIKIPTESEQDNFVERVAIMIFDGGVDERHARLLALKVINERRGK